MDTLAVLLAVLALMCFAASLWYFFKTVRVIWSFSTLMAVAAVIFSPIVHIVFYLLPKQSFDKYEAKLFRRYFASLGALCILAVVASVFIPNIVPQTHTETVDYEDGSAQPWQWDIRAES